MPKKKLTNKDLVKLYRACTAGMSPKLTQIHPGVFVQLEKKKCV